MVEEELVADARGLGIRRVVSLLSNLPTVPQVVTVKENCVALWEPRGPRCLRKLPVATLWDVVLNRFSCHV